MIKVCKNCDKTFFDPFSNEPDYCPQCAEIPDIKEEITKQSEETSPIKRILFVILIGWLLGNGLYDKFFVIPEREQRISSALPLIQKEYSLIQTSPEAILVSSKIDTFTKIRKISFTNRYTTDKTWDDLLNFHLQEAKNNGWTFKKFKTYTDQHGKYTEGRGVIFYKGEYELDIHYNIQNNDHILWVNMEWEDTIPLTSFKENMFHTMQKLL